MLIISVRKTKQQFWFYRRHHQRRRSHHQLQLYPIWLVNWMQSTDQPKTQSQNKQFIHLLDFCTIASECCCFLDGKLRKRGKKTLCKSQELLLSIQSIFKAKQILLNVVDIYKISNELSLKKVDFISIKFIFQQFFWVILTWDYNELLLYLNLWIGLLNGEHFCDKKRKSKYFFFGLQIIF